MQFSKFQFFQKKSFQEVRDTGKNSTLKKTLGAVDLMMLGLGAIIGTGAFVLTGGVAANFAGPAVTLSYAIAGATCIFVALTYTELATMLPTAGTIYTYSYVALGEIFAWLMGSVIILELGFGASTVAAGWSAYITSILEAGGIHLPIEITAIPAEGGYVNLPAMLIIGLICWILTKGTSESKKFNAILVVVKMSVIALFLILAAPHAKLENWQTFMPFGFNKVIVGSSILFFAFTGFGTLATAAEECKNPKRDLTIGIIGSLIFSTCVYMAIAAVVTLAAPYTELDNAKPLAHALSLNGNHAGSAIVATGAVAGMTTVLMMQFFGLSRIFFVISRDGMLPEFFSKLHPVHQTPYLNIWFFGFFLSLIAGFMPYKTVASMSSMGALIDYFFVSLIVLMFRFTMPNIERPFRCPAVFIVAPIGGLACLFLLSKQIIDENNHLLETGSLLIYWFTAMIAIYVFKKVFFDSKNKSA